MLGIDKPATLGCVGDQPDYDENEHNADHNDGSDDQAVDITFRIYSFPDIDKMDCWDLRKNYIKPVQSGDAESDYARRMAIKERIIEVWEYDFSVPVDSQASSPNIMQLNKDIRALEDTGAPLDATIRLSHLFCKDGLQLDGDIEKVNTYFERAIELAKEYEKTLSNNNPEGLLALKYYLYALYSYKQYNSEYLDRDWSEAEREKIEQSFEKNKIAMIELYLEIHKTTTTLAENAIASKRYNQAIAYLDGLFEISSLYNSEFITKPEQSEMQQAMFFAFSLRVDARFAMRDYRSVIAEYFLAIEYCSLNRDGNHERLFRSNIKLAQAYLALNEHDNAFDALPKVEEIPSAIKGDERSKVVSEIEAIRTKYPRVFKKDNPLSSSSTSSSGEQVETQSRPREKKGKQARSKEIQNLAYATVSLAHKDYEDVLVVLPKVKDLPPTLKNNKAFVNKIKSIKKECEKELGITPNSKPKEEGKHAHATGTKGLPSSPTMSRSNDVITTLQKPKPAVKQLTQNRLRAAITKKASQSMVHNSLTALNTIKEDDEEMNVATVIHVLTPSQSIPQHTALSEVVQRDAGQRDL
jgi:hypothetical protein